MQRERHGKCSELSRNLDFSVMLVRIRWKCGVSNNDIRLEKEQGLIYVVMKSGCDLWPTGFSIGQQAKAIKLCIWIFLCSATGVWYWRQHKHYKSVGRQRLHVGDKKSKEPWDEKYLGVAVDSPLHGMY